MENTPAPTTADDSLNDLIKFFFQEVSTLHLEWSTFEQLFDDTVAVGLVNQRTGQFFTVVQSSLLDSINLRIARLFDPTKSVGQRTSSFATAFTQIDQQRWAAALENLKAGLVDLKLHADPIFEHRNRRIAHNDFKVVAGDELLPGISWALMRSVVAEIGSLASLLSIIHTGEEIPFAAANRETGVPTLVKVLTAGNRAIDEERGRFLQTPAPGR